jgi:hypothetical protein
MTLEVSGDPVVIQQRIVDIKKKDEIWHAELIG